MTFLLTPRLRANLPVCTLEAVSSQSTRNRYEVARKRYRPARVNVLFIVEAPPADHRRFFYFEHVKTHDWLFLALMRALYEDARDADTKVLRRRKRDFLRRFKGDGYYLIDALDTPMPKGASPSVKRRLIRESAKSLTKKAARLSKPDTRVVLISSAVYRELSRPLCDAGLNVINVEMIDFPASGRQRLFQKKLRPLLDEACKARFSDLKSLSDISGQASPTSGLETDGW